MIKILHWATFALILGSPGTATAQTCPAGNPLVAPTSRYIDHLDGTVTDTQTGLMWKKCSEGQVAPSCSGVASSYAWADALNSASGVVYAGYDNWRLPNQNELQSLVEYGCHGPAINTVAFPNTAPVAYLSATTFSIAATFAWGTDFLNGGQLNLSKAAQYRVRLVRGE